MNREMLQKAGVNLKKGLNNFSGNQLIYNRFLMSYTTDKHLADSLYSYEQEDYNSVLQQIQALKRIVGKLGIERLAEACQKVEDAIAAEKLEDMAALMDAVQKEHNMVIKALS